MNSKEDCTSRNNNIALSCSNNTPNSIAETAANYDDDKLVGLSVSILDKNSNTNDGEEEEQESQQQQRRILSRGTITIVYASTTGTCASFATRLHHRLLQSSTASSKMSSGGICVRVMKVNDIDWFDELTNDYDTTTNHTTNDDNIPPPILLFILPTWTNGTLPPDSDTLLPSLQDICSDWRIAPEPLRIADTTTTGPSGGRRSTVNNTVRVGVFGMGSSAYDTRTMGKPAKDTFALLVSKLGARPLVSQKSLGRNATTGGGKIKSLVIGDSESGDCDSVFNSWMEGVVSSIFPSSSTTTVATTAATTAGAGRKNNRVSNKIGKAKKDEDETTVGCCNDNVSKATDEGCACKSSTPKDDEKAALGCCSSNNATNDAVDFNKDDDDDAVTDPPSEDDDDDDDDDDSEGGDIVDLEDMGDVIKNQSTSKKTKEPQEMVTPKQAKALKKEGYRLIGTHSAVKLCRWTKHQLRGRGGCYKHTHYGITSYQCMEATPSLACANKCVFCWRHHKNPVGKEWRWKTDDPYMIVDEAVKEHISMIKETRGIPGIQLDRWHEAHTVRHCALSLVGEPIMYPQINELLGELHARKISTFLVTNGQHPQAIEDLIPITQLVSVFFHIVVRLNIMVIDFPLFRRTLTIILV
jgi:FMN phosphatase YigB (HAD superfamily)